MKTVISFFSGLLLLTQSLQAGDPGGGAGLAAPSRPAAPRVSAPVAQGTAAPAAPRGKRSHRSTRVEEQPQISQDQTNTNSSEAVVASSPGERHERHDRDWWNHHFSTIVFVLGGYYYWDSGYWYPAFGYDPNYSYDDDSPIYAFGNLLPDQVIASVQTQLKQNGYYSGPITGSINPSTRAAIANYQRDHGLLVTATVDQPTVASLGLA